jgi:hypothetical protein
MHELESIDDAVRVARQVLAGDVTPNSGCEMIYRLAQAINYPSELGMFLLLGHEQYDHEHLGITAESCIPDILEACRELIGQQA